MSDVNVETDLDWAKGDGLLPAIIQHWRSGEVLMLGYMNRQALAATRASGKVTFFSRSKQRLWTKGESSGHTLILKSVHVDCDADTLLVRAEPIGPTCHRGTPTCFADAAHLPLGFLGQLDVLVKSAMRIARTAAIRRACSMPDCTRSHRRLARRVSKRRSPVLCKMMPNCLANLPICCSIYWFCCARAAWPWPMLFGYFSRAIRNSGSARVKCAPHCVCRGHTNL